MENPDASIQPRPHTLKENQLPIFRKQCYLDQYMGLLLDTQLLLLLRQRPTTVRMKL